MSTLPIARYRFTFAITGPLVTNDYGGSALRGAFGHALRQLACLTRARECEGCPLAAQCPYTEVFAPHERPRAIGPGGSIAEGSGFTGLQQIPVPYVIEAPVEKPRSYAAGDSYVFSMVLMGSALQQLPLVIMAWQRAFSRGISKSRGCGELATVEWQVADNHWQTVFTAASPAVVAHTPLLVMPGSETGAHDANLQLVTPLRLQRQGKIIGAREFTAALFLRNLVRRVSLLQQFHLGQALQFDVAGLNALADAVQAEHNLHWKDWARYSSRQQQKMSLGGLQGQLHLQEVPSALIPYIYLGQWLHVGKETMFGLGSYRVLESPWWQ